MFKRNKILKHVPKKRGQSTVEYIILVAAVLAIIILFLGTGGPFRKSYNTVLHTGTDGMTNLANRLSKSHVSK